MLKPVLNLLVFLLLAGSTFAVHPLAPLDTSSPRATIESFLKNAEDVAVRYREYRESPGPATQATLRQAVGKGWRLLDLSEVPEAARREVGGDALLLLREVIYRLELPALQQIPDASEIKDKR
jgi:MscS family membrane protein